MMVQTAVWLPEQLFKKLKQAGGKRGLGREIRQRLRLSFREFYCWKDGRDLGEQERCATCDCQERTQ
jgi:hypothetical protein